MSNIKKEIMKELDSIQRDIWAGINDELQKRGVKIKIGDAYAAGSSIKEILHPRVLSLFEKIVLEVIGKDVIERQTLWLDSQVHVINRIKAEQRKTLNNLTK